MSTLRQERSSIAARAGVADGGHLPIGGVMAGTDAIAVDEILERVARMAHQALPLYGLSRQASATLINHSENFTYRIDDPARSEPLILRVHRIGYHSRQAIQSELDWMIALRRDAGVETPEPIPAGDGGLIQMVRHAD